MTTLPPGTLFCRRCARQIKGPSVYVNVEGPFCDDCAEVVATRGLSISSDSSWTRWLWGLLGIK